MNQMAALPTKVTADADKVTSSKRRQSSLMGSG
jgi:hypothetical protein